MQRLAGKVAVVTGGTRGIGKAIALTFAQEGADVMVGDIREADISTQDIKGIGGRIVSVKADITQKVEVKAMIQSALDRFSKIDILVNNAGVPGRGNLMDMTEEAWDLTVDVILKGSFLCSQAAAEKMISNRYGKIVNIASIGGLIYNAGISANYASAKAGVIHLTRACAREFGPYGINVNAIAPGMVVTDLVYSGRTQKQAEDFIEDAKKSAVLGRVGAPQDIANVALFLASDESSYITGQVIAVDGGHVGLM
jgi:3-oxoacyl-[acyl-carrier protein] reductase